ncbi:hypothetical protein EYF80_005444 [Liparis tanakae]|uniref:Uncharacterized protein n=1 Tax=Liparis tanakae TaxID=230148 RepID=A0A4Z2J267_9TELE|nr:hypothetical protein EYF80_005444 [Liparis tanakae]
MALPNSSGSPGAGTPNPSVIDLGTIFVDSDVIFGFTSHLLKRKTKFYTSPEDGARHQHHTEAALRLQGGNSC